MYYKRQYKSIIAGYFMKSVEVSIRVETPTLMGGAFRQYDGVRLSEIKGMMRYWFRAIAGSFIVHFPEENFNQDLKNLKEFEGSIFGSTKIRSSFKLMIDKEDVESKYLSHLPHKDWSKKKPLKVIYPGSRFTLKLIITKIPFEETTIEDYGNFLKDLLKLSFFFGIGLRKNRFFGNMALEDEKLEDVEVLITKAKNFISKRFKAYGDTYSIEKRKTLLPLFPTFSYRNQSEKNYYITELKSNCSISNWENFLETFYKGIVHKLKKDNNLRFFVDGNIKKFHKYSLLNFSYINKKIYVSSFFHKNNGCIMSPRMYESWKSGLEKIEEIIKNNWIS